MPSSVGTGRVPGPPVADRPDRARSLETIRVRAERARILAALRATDGRRAHAARLLGVSRKTLWKRLKRLGIASWGVTTR
jgi:transcriptional regulator of acetoin/glycerol metabolism